jgi:hypothetical protein
VGAIAWGLVVYLTKYEIGLLAVVIGYAVGYTVHRVAGAASQSTAIAAGLLAGAGILLGFLFIGIAIVAQAFNVGLFDAIRIANDIGWGDVFSHTVDAMSWLFLAIGAFSAYSLVARSRPQRRR